MPIKVSVCVPVYKVEKYIERCARSLFEQTVADGIEFIFVDDCSPDRSIEILKHVLEQYPGRKSQVRIVRHEVNKGLLEARQTAIGVASGDYIIHCDSDDGVDPDLYERMMAEADAGSLDVVVAPIRMIWDSGNEKVVDADCKSVDDYFKRFFGAPGFNSMINKIVNRSVYDRVSFDRGKCGYYGEDLLLMAQLLAECRTIGFVHNSFYNYFRTRESGTILDADNAIGVRQQLEVARTLSRLLEARYPGALLHYKHICQMRALRSRGFSREEFLALWPESQTWGGLAHDDRLQLYKKVLIFLSASNYSLGLAVVRFLLALRRILGDK